MYGAIKSHLEACFTNTDKVRLSNLSNNLPKPAHRIKITISIGTSDNNDNNPTDNRSAYLAYLIKDTKLVLANQIIINLITANLV